MTNEHQARYDKIEKSLAVILRERRETTGWSRRQIIEHFLPPVGAEIVERSLIAYELLGKDHPPASARALSVRRLLELAAAYDIPASTMLLQAEIRAGRPPQCEHCGHDLQ